MPTCRDNLSGLGDAGSVGVVAYDVHTLGSYVERLASLPAAELVSSIEELEEVYFKLGTLIVGVISADTK